MGRGKVESHVDSGGWARGVGTRGRWSAKGVRTADGAGHDTTSLLETSCRVSYPDRPRAIVAPVDSEVHKHGMLGIKSGKTGGRRGRGSKRGGGGGGGRTTDR